MTGKGILIVHNSDINALVENTQNHEFAGLLIVDDIVRIHNTILGAIFVLTPSPSQGDVIGNGNGFVLFSEEAVVNAISEIENNSNIKYGFGKNRLAVKYWYE